MIRLLKDKLLKITESQELLMSKSRQVIHIFNRMEEETSVSKDSQIKNLNKNYSLCRSLITDHAEICKNFETFASKIYTKLNEYKMVIEFKQHEARKTVER